jgi:hypothetical protein
MESLALLVTFILLAQIVFGLAVIVFAALARFKGKFRRTAIVLLILLAAETAWALWVLPAFGVPSLIALAIAAVLFWGPRWKATR